MVTCVDWPMIDTHRASVVVDCWLIVRVIRSAGDVDCLFPASFSCRWLWFLVIWNSGQLVGMDCSFPASFAFPLRFLGVWFDSHFIHRLLCCAVLRVMIGARKQASWRLTGHQQNDVVRFRGSEWRRRPHECHCTGLKCSLKSGLIYIERVRMYGRGSRRRLWLYWDSQCLT